MRLKHIGIATALLAALILAPAVGAAPAANTQTSVPLNIAFETVVSGLTQPVFATGAGDGTGRIFIVQQTGQILILKGKTLNSTPFLDVSSLLGANNGEQGLLGLAFDPNYATNGYFYITYTGKTGPAGDDYLARYHVSSNPDVADPSSRQTVLAVGEPYSNHNGGNLAFGPDGYLYFGLGDGGSGGDPQGNGQNTNVLLGKILRLNVDSTFPYTIPSDNPFASGGGKPEIWSYGVRNPWRFSFDKSTGDLYIGDVGQDTEEEIDFQAAGAAGGQNYGWNLLEGNLCYLNSPCPAPAGYVAPVAVYDHGAGDSTGCAVTGGYVYRGSAFPGLQGVYLFGDYCSGRLWGLYRNASNKWVKNLIKVTGYNISSFAQDEAGELYIVDYGGSLIHIKQAPVVSLTLNSIAAQDGTITELKETSNTGGFANSSSTVLSAGDTVKNQQVKSILSFATGRVPNGAVISSAKLRLWQTSLAGDPFGGLGGLVADIGKPFFGSSAALAASDFQAAAGAQAVAVFPNTPISGWYSATLTQAALAKISLTANTQFRLRFTRDDNNNGSPDRINFSSGNAASNQPQLVISYFVP